MRAKLFLALLLFSSLTACGGRVPSSLAEDPGAADPGAGAPVDENPPAPPDAPAEPPADPPPAGGGSLQEQAANAWAFINIDGDEFMTPEEMTAFFQSVIDGGMATARVRSFRTMQYRPMPMPQPQMQRMALPQPQLRRFNDDSPAALMTQDFFSRFDSDGDSLLTYTEFETGFITLAQEGQMIQTYARQNPNGARILRMRQILLTGR